MEVAQCMSPTLVTVGPDHTLREAAQHMTERGVGAAVVLDVDGEGPGIVTERDVLRSVAEGQDPDVESVRGHLTESATVAGAHTTIERAAETMLAGAFRHLIVVDDDGQPLGMLSMRDVVRALLSAVAAAR